MMDFQRYLDILAKYKAVVAVTILIVVATVGIGSLLTPPSYSASALVRIAERREGAVNVSDINYTTRLMNTYVELLKSRPFVSEVGQRLGLNASFDQLAPAISVEPKPDTELIRISAESQNPRQAAAIANTLAELLVEQGQKLYSGQGKSTRESFQEQAILIEEQLKADRASLAQISQGQPSPSQSVQIQELNTRIRLKEQSYSLLVGELDRAQIDETIRANAVSVVEAATEPRSPSRPRVVFNLLLGALVGLIGGVGLVFVFYNLSPMVRDAADLAPITNFPLLASIPLTQSVKPLALAQKRGDGLLVIGGRSLSGQIAAKTTQMSVDESVRALVATIFARSHQPARRTILITSVEPGLAKSALIANLASVIARSGQSVIVVGADPVYGRRWEPTRRILESISLKIESGPEASAPLILSRFTLHLYATQVSGVRILMGPLDAEANHQVHWVDVLAKPEVTAGLLQQADVVLFDGSPMLLRADSLVLSSLADGVILVVNQNKTPRNQMVSALKDLEALSALVLGVVLNTASIESEESFHLQPESEHEGLAGARSRLPGLAEPKGHDKVEEGPVSA